MSEKINKNDVIEDKILSAFIQEAIEAEKRIKAFDDRLKSLAETIRNDLSKSTDLNIDNLQKWNALEKEAEKRVKQKKQNVKELSVVEQERLKIQKAVEKAQAQKVLADSKENKELQQLRVEKNKINKATRDEIKQAERAKNAYTKLSDESRRYKNESKRLGAELLKLNSAENKNVDQINKLEKEYKDVTRQAQLTDSQLKKLDATVGDNQRKVGAYTNATAKLTSGLKMLAGAAGLGALIGGLGSVTKELSRAENQARLFFNTSKEGTKEIAQEAMILAKVFDKDVNEVLRAANALSKQFGVDGNEALNLINQGFEKGGDVSGELIDNVTEYSTLLRLAGLNAEQSISIITQSQQQGVFSDKGIDAIKEATLSLRELTPPAQEALQAIGMSAEQVQKDIASGSKSYFDIIQEISNKTGEVGEESQAAGMILADIFKGAGEDAGDFIFSLGEMNTSLEDLEDQNKGLEGAIQNITREWYEFVFGVEEGTGAIDKFSGVINFVADNLGAIIKTLGRLAALYLIIKARQKFINSGLSDYVKNLFKANTAQKGLNKSMDSSSKGANKFGKSLKGIGWAALIGVAIELAVAFYDIASGAAEARRKQQELDDYRADAEKKSTESVNKYNKEYEKRLFNLNEEERILKSKAKTQQEVDEIALKFLEKRQKEAAKQTKLFDTLNQQAQEKIDKDLKSIEVLEKLDVSNGQILYGSEQLAKQLREAGFENAKYNSTWASINVTVDEAIKRKSELTARVEAARVRQENYTEALEQADKILTTVTNDIAVDSNERENNRDKINAQVKGLKDQNDELETQSHWLDENIDYWQQYFDHIKKMREEDDILTIDESEFGDMLGEAPVLPDDEVEEVEDQQKELYDIINTAQENITKVYSDHVDRRIELAQREIDSQQELRSILQAQAEAGNIDAQDSIKATIEAEREKEAEIIRLEKRKQQVQMISQGLQTYLNLLEGGEKPAAALAQTAITSKGLIKLLSGLQGFWKGTEYAPEGLALTQEKGAEIITDKKGNIKSLGSDGGSQLTYLEKGDKVKTASETTKFLNSFENLNNEQRMPKQDVAGNSYDIMLLGSKLDRIERAIKTQPKSNSDFQTITKGLSVLTKTTNSGGDKSISKHYIKR